MEVKIIKIHIHRISRRLKNLREERRLTQEELAGQLGISRQSIISVEHGKCLPSLPLALRIAGLFDLPLEKIFYIDESHKDIKKGGETMPRTLMPWSPFGDLDLSRLARAEAGRFFDDEDIPLPRWKGLAFPAVNVRQTDKEVILTADIPGISEEELQVEVGNDFVDISGERREEKKEEDEGYLRQEVRFGNFTRRIPLPTEVSADKAEAIVKDGLLKLIIPKVKPTKIKVTKVKVKKA